MKVASMLREIVVSLFRRPFTELYPFVVRPSPARLRGKLLWAEEKCRGCLLCVRDCPAEAIEIEIVDRASKVYTFHYRIDRCIYCAQCVASCREGALSMSSTQYHTASADRATFTEVYRSKGSGACTEGETDT